MNNLREHVAAVRAARTTLLLAGAALAAAVAWLLLRVFLGLELTDEMQYYGEIAGLVRTGRFFHDDLFVQQLGYFFLLPFFKLHAAVFPDQSYLVVFGRFLMVALYGSVGLLFWRATTRCGEFSAAQRLAGLAALAAWVPFQILAPGYNSLAYLLVVASVSVWLAGVDPASQRHPTLLAALLAALTTTYPPAGLAGLVLAGLDTARRRGSRAALAFVALTFGIGILIGAGMFAMHGRDFFSDLMLASKFSRAFGVAETIRQPAHLARLGAFVATGGFLVWWMAHGYHEATSPSASNHRAVWIRSLLLGGCAALLLVTAVRWDTGTFATTVFFTLLLLLASGTSPTSSAPRIASLAVVGLTLGAVFSITSGNGVHNFGVGAAGVIPFLLLEAAHLPPAEGPSRWMKNSQSLFVVVFAGLILVNGIRHPYRERYDLGPLQRVSGVPAFRGLWTTPLKTEVLGIFSALASPGSLRGKHLLVAGPHAAFYFLSGGEPTTPMFFMHYTGNPEAYALVADQLFRTGSTDAILVTNTLPPPIRAKVDAWISRGCIERRASVPAELNRQYAWLTGYDFLPEVRLLIRPPSTPPHE